MSFMLNLQTVKLNFMFEYWLDSGSLRGQNTGRAHAIADLETLIGDGSGSVRSSVATVPPSPIAACGGFRHALSGLTLPHSIIEGSDRYNVSAEIGPDILRKMRGE